LRTPADPAPASAVRYDGASAEELARRLELPRVVVYDEIGSTLDVAHSLAAEGAPAGTLILADAQSAGRGRSGRAWTSERGAGIWLTLVERPRDTDALDVLSLRVGIGLAAALESYSDERIRLKWPNDLYVGDRKLGGILVEARWRDRMPEWVAIGVGINVRAPVGEDRATGLRPDSARLTVLAAAVPTIRAASARCGALDESELQVFAARDLASGRACSEPLGGVVRGIDSRGSLLVDVGSHTVAVRTGSLVLTEAR
jgi:BirA family biotin operon repressor/biotin-[acetyl-CoA-carboxylase] ligase